MKALFLRDNLKLSLEETDKPTIIEPTDIIVRVTASSICGSDIHFVTGEVPLAPNFIIGHEGVGVVDEVGTSVKNFKPGDRVAIPAGVACGQCPECRAGRGYACEKDLQFGVGKARGDLGGVQAEYVRIPYADVSVIGIPDSVSDKEALFVGDILSTGYFGVINGKVTPGDDVAIFGAGPVGLSAVACARLYSPARIFLIDLEDYRLEAGRKLGATHLINASNTKAAREIRRITNGVGVPVSIDAAGFPSTIDDCLACTAKGGIVSVIGMSPFHINFAMGKMFYKNLTLISGYTSLEHMERLLKLIEFKQLDLTGLITHEFPLSNIMEAYRVFQNRLDNCIKIVIVPD
jgi:alcohol dehydrogenase